MIDSGPVLKLLWKVLKTSMLSKNSSRINTIINNEILVNFHVDDNAVPYYVGNQNLSAHAHCVKQDLRNDVNVLVRYAMRDMRYAICSMPKIIRGGKQPFGVSNS